MEILVALAWPAVVLILGVAFISLLAVVAWRPDRATPPAGPIPPEIVEMMLRQQSATPIDPTPDEPTPAPELPEIE